MITIVPIYAMAMTGGWIAWKLPLVRFFGLSGGTYEPILDGDQRTSRAGFGTATSPAGQFRRRCHPGRAARVNHHCRQRARGLRVRGLLGFHRSRKYGLGRSQARSSVPKIQVRSASLIRGQLAQGRSTPGMA
jgi:hypothetical protein